MKFNFCRKNRRSSINQKKYIFMILVLWLLSVLIISGCNNAQDGGEQKLDIAALDPDKVSAVAQEADYSVGYASLPDLAAASQQIVYGEVESVEYLLGENGDCRTNTEVRVIQGFKGDYQEGDTIKIVEGQGIASAYDYINSFTEELRDDIRNAYSQFTDDELKDRYIQMVEYGDFMVEPGQKSIYFLKESSSYDTEQTYCRLSGPEYQYYEIADNEFVAKMTAGIMNSNTELNRISPDIADIIYEKSEIKTFTLDEIVDELKL